MDAFCITFPTLSHEQKISLGRWAHRRLREYDFKTTENKTIFSGLFNFEHDPKRFDATMKRNLKNWGVPFTIYDRNFIRKMSREEYLNQFDGIAQNREFAMCRNW